MLVGVSPKEDNSKLKNWIEAHACKWLRIKAVGVKQNI